MKYIVMLYESDGYGSDRFAQVGESDNVEEALALAEEACALNIGRREWQDDPGSYAFDSECRYWVQVGECL